MQYVYKREVASPVVTVIVVPLHTEQLYCCPGQEEAESEARPLRLFIPEVKAYTVDRSLTCNKNKHRETKMVLTLEHPMIIMYKQVSPLHSQRL